MKKIINDMQNIKAVFDAAIKVVIKPSSNRKEKTKKKQRDGCSLSSVLYAQYLEFLLILLHQLIFNLELHL